MRDVPRRSESECLLRPQLLGAWFCEQGLFAADDAEPASFSPRALTVRSRYLSADVELTFLGHPFEGFSRALDPVLAVVAVGRKQANDLIGAAGAPPPNLAGVKTNGR